MRSGIDHTAVDPDVRPQDDLFAHVNGRWLATTRDPRRPRRATAPSTCCARRAEAARPRASSRRSRPATPSPAPSRPRSATSTPASWTRRRVEALGRGPAAPTTSSRCARCRTPATSLALSSAPSAARGVLGLVSPFVNTDDRDPSRYLVYLEQAGLGLPDESYYREDAYADDPHRVRRARRADARRWPGGPTRGRRRAGHGARDAAGRGALGPGDATATPVKTYTLVDLAGARRDGRPASPGCAYLEGLGGAAAAFDEVVVRQPDFLAVVAAALADEPGRGCGATGSRWHVVHAPRALPVRRGRGGELRLLRPHPDRRARSMRERWKRGVGLVEEALGEAVGQLYVERHFPPAAKAPHGRARRQPRRGLPAQHRRCSTGWATRPRREALDKLGQFTPKIGYPEQVARLLRPARSSAATCWATSAARRGVRARPRRSPSSASRSTATSGS